MLLCSQVVQENVPAVHVSTRAPVGRGTIITNVTVPTHHLEAGIVSEVTMDTALYGEIFLKLPVLLTL